MTITNHNMVEDKFGGRGFIDQDLRIAEKFYPKVKGQRIQVIIFLVVEDSVLSKYWELNFWGQRSRLILCPHRKWDRGSANPLLSANHSTLLFSLVPVPQKMAKSKTTYRPAWLRRR